MRRTTIKRQISAIELLALALRPPVRFVRNWYLRRLEDHYLISAECEQVRSNQAANNVLYYQRQAALARSARLD